MSTPDPHTPRTRTEVAVAWVTGHFGELAAVVSPLVLAATVTWWFALASAVAALWWALHEARNTRRRREIETAAGRAQLTGPTTTPDTISGARKEDSA